jgi:hypothetical protein
MDVQASEQHMQLDIGNEVNRLATMIPASDPFKNVFLSLVMPQSSRQAPAEEFLSLRASQMTEANVIAKNFRANTRMRQFPSISELRKSGQLPVAKANLDVGTLTTFASITGGQTLGYVSLDTQMARGTVRPGSFTLYQALAKTRAFQVVDFWPSATDTGGPPPGAAFGKYQLNNIQLKLVTNGRAITTALAAQNSFVDITAQENINAALTCLETINWACYWGASANFSNQFAGAYSQIPSGNVVDYQVWYNSQAASQGWSPQQALFNLIYQWSAQITKYNRFGRITHAFMSPTCAGSLQGLVTTVLNNIVTEITDRMGGPSPIVVNGDLQGMRTRFGEIQFPIDLYITARDIPVQAVSLGDGTNLATAANPTPAASATVTTVGTGASGSTAWTATWTASSGIYTYAVAAVDSSMNESTLTYASPVSGIVTNGAYSVAITGASTTDFIGFRVFRTGLSDSQSSNQNPASFRYVGFVAATGSAAKATFIDKNTHIPGSDTIFLFDLDEQDNALDFRYLLPLTKIELFAQNLFMPWAVAAIGGLRMRIPKFHGVIQNFVSDDPDFNPLTANTNAV